MLDHLRFHSAGVALGIEKRKPLGLYVKNRSHDTGVAAGRGRRLRRLKISYSNFFIYAPMTGIPMHVPVVEPGFRPRGHKNFLGAPKWRI
jgi:hypothetical protein